MFLRRIRENAWMTLEKFGEMKWFVQETPSALQPIFPGAEGATVRLHKRTGLGYAIVWSFLDHSQLKWVYEEGNLAHLAQKVIGLYRSGRFDRWYKEWEKDLEALYGVCGELDKATLHNMPNAALWKSYERFYDAYVQEYSLPLWADAVGVFYLSHLFERKLREALKRAGKENEFNRIFTTLSQPSEPSFVAEERMGLLKIAEIVQRNKNDPTIPTKLQEHARQFHWVTNNYLRTVALGESYFLERVQEILEKNPSNELARIQKEIREITPKKQALLSELNDSGISEIVGLIDLFATWQDDRKKANLIADHYLDVLLQEFAKRGKLSLSETKWLLPKELPALLKGKKFTKQIKERQRHTAILWTPKGYRMWVGEKAKQVQKSILKPKENVILDEIRGQCASMGKVVGRVKVIRSAEELERLNDGEVLVTSMTRPEFVAGMKKAAAIVTDEGGITSHAAIVSRELGVPCIIGTKIATKILKDGDLVEVNANHGVVKKIQEAKS